MKLRSHFLVADGNDVSGAGLCGTAPLLDINLATNLQVLIKVNGTIVLQTMDFSTFTTDTVTVGSLIVNITKINNVGVLINIPLVNVWDSATVEISASKTNYCNYSNGFVVYGYDLGNDQNALDTYGNPVTHNPDMDIVMMRDWSSLGSQAGNAYSKFVAYRQPFTDHIYYYDLVSQPQKYSYTVAGDATVIGTTRNGMVCGHTDTTIVQAIQVGHLVGCNFVVDDSCNSSQLVSMYSTMKPPFELGKGCNKCTKEDCIDLNTEFTAETFINNNPDFQTFWVDDALVPPFDEMTLTYDLVDLNGTILTTQNYTIPVTIPFVPDPTNYPFTAALPASGDYIVIVTLSVAGVFDCKKSLAIKGCSSSITTLKECGVYNILNNSLDTLHVGVVKITQEWIDNVQATAEQNGGDDFWGSVIFDKLVDIPPNEEFVINLSGDGFYAFVYLHGDGKDQTTEIKYVVVTCDLEACIQRFIKAIMCAKQKPCGCGDGCDDCRSGLSQMVYNLNAIMSIWAIIIGTTYNNPLLAQTFTGDDFKDGWFGGFLQSYAYQVLGLFNLEDYFNKVSDYCINCSIGLEKVENCGCSK